MPRCRCAGAWARPGTSPTPRCSWPPTRPTSSPASRSPSTAAPACARSELSSRHLLPGSTDPHAPAPADIWIPATSAGMTRGDAMRTQVGIVGAGPAGLLLARLLGLAGIDVMVLEKRDPEYLRARVRAGLLEQGTVDLLMEAGVGDRLARERLIHEGVELAFDGKRHRIDLKGLTGQVVTIYGQAEIQKDLMAAHETAGTAVVYEAGDVSLHGLTSDKPQLRYHKAGQGHAIDCDFIAGCDGFHGVSRQASPQEVLRICDRAST